MTSSSSARTFAALALCLGALGICSSARADIMVVLDCFGNGGQPDWARSNNRITVTATIHVDGQPDFPLTLGSSAVTDCRSDDQGGGPFMSAAFNSSNVKDIRVTTNGTDVLFIDKIKLFSGTRNVWGLAGRWGVDDNTGWCVSRDSRDGNNPFCTTGLAFTTWIFPM
jgi:hypothetical protein